MITLYGCRTSSASKRVRIALCLKDIEYQYVEVDLQQGEHLAPSYRELNAQKKLPLLMHNGQILTQSLAIIEYLNDIQAGYEVLPREPLARAWCRSFAALFAADYHPLITRRVVDRLRASGLTENAIGSWKLQWLDESLRVAEKTLSQRAVQHAFCCGTSPTMADICLFAQCESARKQGIDLSCHKTVFGIYALCNELDAFKEVQ
ncbi:maleylacetoacetate isomerase [Serratia sp. root2]|uniref:maleylacetoacetate isomerase n=1 Tax=Serratia sp. root2 TaxID=3059676 RepID=UPI00288FFBEB|nr:maleylacetoacetate isomerase [Serratia sp. root2]MDT3249635.1 maleylacetoacetate isomerase [Serratia sp. root2]